MAEVTPTQPTKKSQQKVRREKLEKYAPHYHLTQETKIRLWIALWERWGKQ